MSRFLWMGERGGMWRIVRDLSARGNGQWRGCCTKPGSTQRKQVWSADTCLRCVLTIDHGFGSVQFRKFAAVRPVYLAGAIVGVRPSKKLTPVPPSILFASAGVKTATEFRSPGSSPNDSVSLPAPVLMVTSPTKVTGV